MLTNTIYDFHYRFKDNAFVLCYMGEFDDELTSILMDVSESCKSGKRSTQKKVTYLIAECFQNIVRHSDKKADTENISSLKEMFVIKDNVDYHQIVTSNIIHKKYQERLTQRLEDLSEMTKDQLKDKFIQTFSDDRTERGGAGLGLIDIARKSGTSPVYNFIDCSPEYSNFFMEVNIVPSNEEPNELNKTYNTIGLNIDLYNSLAAEKIIILQKGDFSQEAILPIIQLFENNIQLKSIDNNIAGKVTYLLIEMLQNITRHASIFEGVKEGIFYISEDDNATYKICTGNFIQRSESEKIALYLDEIKDLDKIGLSKKYKEKLMDFDTPEDSGAGIGLIELCRMSNDKLIYDIRPVNDEFSFFTLQVNI